MTHADDDDPASQLKPAADPAWDALVAARDALALAQTEHRVYTTVGGEGAGTPEDPMTMFGYIGGPELWAAINALDAVGVFVPFDWMNWDPPFSVSDVDAEQAREALERVSLADAQRLAVMIVRAGRFNEGLVELLAASGVFGAVIDRILAGRDKR